MKCIEERLTRILKYMGIPRDQFNLDSSFGGDFGFNDFQIAGLIFYIELYFKVCIPDENIDRIKTIGSTINYIADLVLDHESKVVPE